MSVEHDRLISAPFSVVVSVMFLMASVVTQCSKCQLFEVLSGLMEPNQFGKSNKKAIYLTVARLAQW